MKSPLLHRFIVILVCFVAGWLAASAVWPEPAATRTARIIPQAPAKNRPAAELDDLINAVHRAGGPTAQMKAALALAASLSPADYQRMLERVRFLPEAAQKFFTPAVLRRWIEMDPATAVKWCVGNADLNDAMRHWTERDPAAARAFVATLPALYRNSAVSGCAAALAATDPAAAMAFIARFGIDEYPVAPALHQLAKHDPGWLLKRSESLPASLRGIARTMAVSEMGRNDLTATVAWARQQPDQTALLSSLLNGIKDQRAALSVITCLPQHLQQSLLDSWASELSRKDHKETLTLLNDVQGLSEQAVKRLMDSAVRYLAAKDPAAAAAQLQTEFPNRVDMWAQALARTWAVTDLSAAKAWAATLPEGTARQQAIQTIEQIESRQAVATASTPLERLLGKGQPSRYVDQGDVLRLSPAERAAILQEISGPKQKDDYRLANIRGGMKQFFPAEYARWLAAEPEQSSQTSQFAREWAGEEPQAAAAWVLKLPAGEAKTTAIACVAGQWAALDPAAARQWVQSLPPGPERNTALQAVQPPAPTQ